MTREAVFLALLVSLPVFSGGSTAAGEAGQQSIDRIWLSHASPDTTRVVVSWETSQPGDSVVEFGTAASLGQAVRKDEPVRLHQVDVPAPTAEGQWHYRVRSGKAASETIAARGWEKDTFRAAIVADIGYAKPDWIAAVLRQKPHLLLTAGDNVPQLHQGKGPAAKDDVSAFRRLVDGAPELFRTTPFLPVLGNHDRQLRPRGPKPPPEPVYDVDATAFRKFFALPGEEWKWTFDVPSFAVRFIAVDLNHVSDLGTTWQTCHDFRPGSEQFKWYRRTMAASRQPFVVTLYNERNGSVRGLAKGAWWPIVSQGSLAVTGFGYYAERAVVKGFPCLNTSVSGRGDRYPDAASVFLKSEDNFVLLTFWASGPSREGKARAELRSLTGEVLDAIDLPPRK